MNLRYWGFAIFSAHIKTGQSYMDGPILFCTDCEKKTGLLLSGLAVIGEFERGLIRERSRESRERVKARGVRFGGHAKKTDEEIAGMVRMFETDELNKRDIAEIYGISKSSVYRL